ncbi:MAG: hypothetical protein AcusKO_40850 [Acuticoccus sp.]
MRSPVRAAPGGLAPRGAAPVSPLSRLAVLAALALWPSAAAHAQDGVPMDIEFVAEEINRNPTREGVTHTLTFVDSGTVAGNAGCNQYSAGYANVGDAVIFQPPRLTRMACLPEAMDAEQQFLAYLLIATSFQYNEDKGTLDLNGANGRPVIRLTRR